MEPRGYFGTDIEEKAAKWDMRESLKEKRAHLAVLRHRAEVVGDALQSFGAILANQTWKLAITEETITCQSPIGLRERNFVLPISYLDGKSLKTLIQETQETETKLEALTKMAADAGI